MKCRQQLFLQFFILLAFLFPVISIAQVNSIWALGDGEKVYRDELQHSSKTGNFTWDGKRIYIPALYNEVVAFQVIIESGNDTVKGIELSVSAPQHVITGKPFAANTLAHGPDGYIEVFSEHYLQVKDSTHPNWYYGSPAAAPKQMKGWIPDALIPVTALSGRGGFPITISPKQNQGFWVDIELPRNQKDFAPGIYKGMVLILQDGKSIGSIPYEIELLPQYLPDEDKATIWAFAEDAATYFPEMSKKQVDDMLKFEAHRHRVTLAGGYPQNASPFDEAMMDSYKTYFDGSAYTPANGYRGGAEGKGEKLFPIGMYGSPVMGKTKNEVQLQSDLWVNWFKKNAPQVKYFWYITDEPDSAKLLWVKERAGWVHGNSGTGKALPLFTTTAFKKNMADVIDYWAGFDGVDLTELPQIRKKGGDHWFYNGNRPRYGSVILEAAAIDFRVNSWIMYKYGINTYFLWHTTAWKHNGQGPKRHLHQDVFSTALTFINDDMDFGNGDGILFYPGHMPYYPEQERGLSRVLPSIRLKNMRRGQQDAALLQMAEQKIGREKVLALVNKVVPKAMSEVPMNAPVPWSQKGDEYDRVRGALLEVIRNVQ